MRLGTGDNLIIVAAEQQWHDAHDEYNMSLVLVVSQEINHQQIKKEHVEINTHSNKPVRNTQQNNPE